MRPNTAIVYSWFLIFLTLGHEFTAAYRISNFRPLHDLNTADPLEGEPFRVPTSNSFRAPDNPSIDPDYFNGDSLLYVHPGRDVHDDQIVKKDYNESDESFVQPEKRIGTLVSLAISGGIMIAGVGFEAWMKLAGCCKSGYKSICNDVEEYENHQKFLVKEFDRVDHIALTAKNVLTDITLTNNRISEVWNDLKRINELKSKFLKEISPETIKLFNTKWELIRRQLRKLNQTVRYMTYDDLKKQVQYKSFLDDIESTSIALSGLGGLAFTALGVVAYRRYQTHQLNKRIKSLTIGREYKMLATARHTKAARVMGVSKVGMNAHIKSTVKGIQDRKFNKPKWGKTSKALNAIAILIAIGVQIYATIKAFEQCRTAADKARKGLKDIRKARSDVMKTHKSLQDYIKLIDNKGYKYIKHQLTGQQFLLTLERTLQLARNAGRQSRNITIAATKIDAFIMGIRDANAKRTYKLTIDLADALGHINFLYACYINKIRLVNYVNERCANGTRPLKKLFDDASRFFNTGSRVNDKACQDDAGVPYYSFKNMTKAWTIESKKLNKSLECRLNDPNIQGLVCYKKNHQGKNVDQIARELDLKKKQVEKLVANCALLPLTPREQRQVCKLKRKRFSLEEVADWMEIPKARIKPYYDKC